MSQNVLPRDEQFVQAALDDAMLCLDVCRRYLQCCVTDMVDREESVSRALKVQELATNLLIAISNGGQIPVDSYLQPVVQYRLVEGDVPNHDSNEGTASDQ